VAPRSGGVPPKPGEDPDGTGPLTTVEADIQSLLGKIPVTPLPGVPDYVTHHPNVNEVGQISAEALAIEYEKTAKAVESLADDLRAMHSKCNEETMKLVVRNNEVLKTIEGTVSDCATTAQHYRDEAKKIFETIQNAALVAEEVRRTLFGLQQKAQNGKPDPVKEEQTDGSQDRE
jgi:hypothetical protein